MHPSLPFFLSQNKLDGFPLIETDGSFSVRVLPSSLMAAEKEEAKAVLTLFIKKQGLSNASAARTINKSDAFVDHLISRLHSVHKSRYLVGSFLLFSVHVKTCC